MESDSAAGATRAANMAAFLRDVVEVTTKQQLTVEAQVADGFAFWLDDAADLDEVRSAFLDRKNDPAACVLEIGRPRDRPIPMKRPTGAEWESLSEFEKKEERAADLRFQQADARWKRHKDLYDNVFGARTPPETMELVLATGLLTSGPAKRHLIVAPVDIDLDRSTQMLRVSISDSARSELNWTDPAVRRALGDASAELQDLQDALTYEDARQAADAVRASFGLEGVVLGDGGSGAAEGKVGLGVAPAILLRKRDSSFLLQLLRDMADDIQADGLVSEPFKMILSATYRPALLAVDPERAALPLPANQEQREMIDNARRERHLVIQGPPGTGKTHTIANLASVLMAEGRRVLITAETERALSEVQAKLPEDMRPLMLPLLKERNTGHLQASVNALTARAGNGTTAEQRKRSENESLASLERLSTEIAETEAELVRIAGADRKDRTFVGTTMRVSGHLQVLAAAADRLEIIDRFLDPERSATPIDAADLVRLTPVVTAAHRSLADHKFPEGLLSTEDLALWLQDHRAQIGVLPDPLPFDHSSLADRVDELAKLSRLLQGLPTTAWTDLTRTTEEYREFAQDVAAVAGDIDHSVTLDMPHAFLEAEKLCQEYLELDATRYDVPLEDLRGRFEKAERHATSANVLGEFDRMDSAASLTKICEDALMGLRRDRSGLLSRHVADHRAERFSSVDELISEATLLVDGSRDGVGLPVVVSEGAPSSHELAAQASTLLEHLAGGGKMTGMVRPPRAVRDAEELIHFVRVSGSEIDTEVEAKRAFEFFHHQTQIVTIDAWAERHALSRPQGTSHHDWLVAIAGVPAVSIQVLEACKQVSALVHFPFGTEPADPEQFLMAALATISKSVADQLRALASAASNSPKVSLAGLPIRSRSDAQRALAAIRAAFLRRDRHRMLPPSWAERCNPVDVDSGDVLAEMLFVAAAAAEIPGRARTADLTPVTVNRIAERAQTDRRRTDLADEYERVVGALQRQLTVCVPQSPATQAVAAALQAEDAAAYRLATEELVRERSMADEATRLDAVRRRVSFAHPRLVAAFDNGDPDALRVLEVIAEFEHLRDYRVAVRQWKDEIGTAESVHSRLVELHKEFRRAEATLASQRCWARAIDRLQERRELRSALSSLSNAMDAVPKTKTAKTYPSRVRAVRAATRAAAPAIPCWVMSIDRVAEVLGYPKQEERFDVVIIDEASQAWFPAMFLYAIADQVIVVGDKMQTSPSRVMGVDELSSITREHIFGHRLADRVGADLSLYDVAEVMTGPEMMVDHFRCVPEIIDISNRLSYAPMGRSLKPSRVREPGALTPVIHVPVGGVRIGSSANEQEVNALVSQLVLCHASADYDGMDFGVVVVGPRSEAHIKLLRTTLLERLGPQAMRDRNLEVGNASQFQGAERNVIFLSLVEGPAAGERIRIWPHEHAGRAKENVQRLNVAVSRARDQLWVFHSFSLSQLAPHDVRLEVLQAPPAEGTSREEQREKCESQFERDVFDALVNHAPDLEIRTQVEALGYSIDLVLQDDDGHRLAVECDGDRWHTSDSQVRADLYRQRTLETIGWRFHRFLASEWYDDPDRHLQAMLAALAKVERTSAKARRTFEIPDSPSNAETTEHGSDAVGEDSSNLTTASAWDDTKSVGPNSPRLFEVVAANETTFGRTQPSDTETLYCEECNQTWEQPTARGRKPSVCPDCRSASAQGSAVTLNVKDSGQPLTPRGPARAKANNRALAAALRERKKPVTGETWERAKKLFAKGASIDEAADQA